MASRPFYVRERNAWYLKYRPDPLGPWVKVKLCRNQSDPRPGVTPKVPETAIAKAHEFERIEYDAKHGLSRPKAKPVALSDYLDSYATSHALVATPGTVKHLERGVKRFKAFAASRGIVLLRSVTGTLCREYLDSRIKSVLASTLRTERGYLMGAWSRAVEDELIPANPWDSARVKGKSPEPTYTHWDPREIERISAQCTEPWQSDLVLFMANTGLRIQTALASRWSWVDTRAGTLRIEPGPKVKTAYTTSPTPFGMVLIERMRAGAVSPLIFGREGSERPYSYTTARDAIDRAVNRAGVRHGTPHDIRHSFGRSLSLQGVPPTIIQKLMGHASLKMTMRYISADSDQAAPFLKGVDLGGGGITDGPPGT